MFICIFIYNHVYVDVHLCDPSLRTSMNFLICCRGHPLGLQWIALDLASGTP